MTAFPKEPEFDQERIHSTLWSESVVLTGKNVNMIDTTQDHCGHFCFHEQMMRDQLVVQGLESGQDYGDC